MGGKPNVIKFCTKHIKFLRDNISSKYKTRGKKDGYEISFDLPVNLVDNDPVILACVWYFVHLVWQNLIPYQIHRQPAEMEKKKKNKQGNVIKNVFYSWGDRKLFLIGL